MPHSRPMPSVGPRCHELRITDQGHEWRIVYRLERDAVLIIEVFSKKTQGTPDQVLETCRRCIALYERAKGERR